MPDVMKLPLSRNAAVISWSGASKSENISPGKRPRIHSQGGFADRQYDKRNRRIEPTAESGGHVHPAHELSFVA